MKYLLKAVQIIYVAVISGLAREVFSFPQLIAREDDEAYFSNVKETVFLTVTEDPFESYIVQAESLRPSTEVGYSKNKRSACCGADSDDTTRSAGCCGAEQADCCGGTSNDVHDTSRSTREAGEKQICCGLENTESSCCGVQRAARSRVPKSVLYQCEPYCKTRGCNSWISPICISTTYADSSCYLLQKTPSLSARQPEEEIKRGDTPAPPTSSAIVKRDASCCGQSAEETSEVPPSPGPSQNTKREACCGLQDESASKCCGAQLTSP